MTVYISRSHIVISFSLTSTAGSAIYVRSKPEFQVPIKLLRAPVDQQAWSYVSLRFNRSAALLHTDAYPYQSGSITGRALGADIGAFSPAPRGGSSAGLAEGPPEDEGCGRDGQKHVFRSHSLSKIIFCISDHSLICGPYLAQLLSLTLTLELPQSYD